MQYPGVILSIDFGTSNTAAALYTPDGQVRTLRLGNRSDLMPSAVMLTDGGFLIGEAATRSALLDPTRYEPSPKRRLSDGTVMLGDRFLPATDLAAEVLKDVLKKAARFTNQPVATVILTHPDRWGPATIHQLKTAALASGIPEHTLAFVTEAHAAAWHYTTTGTPLSPGERLAVLDYGAGTCDVAVLEKNAVGFRVLVADGHEGLGGNDIDAHIWSWVTHQLAGSNPALAAELSSADGIRTQLSTQDRIREAKESLSEYPTAPIPVTGKAGDVVLTLTRNELNTLITRDLSKAVQLTHTLINQSGPPAPTRIYLTGGTSHIPHLHTLLTSVAPIATLDDPKTVVAKGAITAWLGTRGAQSPPPPRRVPTPPTPPPSAPPRKPTPPPAPPRVSTPPRVTTPPPPRQPTPPPTSTPPRFMSTPPPARRGRGRLFAAVTVGIVVLLIAAFGIWKWKSSSDNAEVEAALANLDIGAFSTDPRDLPAKVGSVDGGKWLESHRMLDVVADPRDLDSSFNYRTSSWHIDASDNMSAWGADTGTPNSSVSATLARNNFVAAATTSGTTFPAKAESKTGDRLLSVALLRFPDASAANAAAKDIIAANSRDSSMRKSSIPGYSQADARWYAGSKAIGATLTSGPFIIEITTWGNTEETLGNLVSRIFDAQLKLLQNFEPTPVSDLASMDMDKDGVLKLVVASPNDKSTDLKTAGTFGARATRFVITDGQGMDLSDKMKRNNVELITYDESTTLTRAASEGDAAQLQSDFASLEAGSRVSSPVGLDSATCFSRAAAAGSTEPGTFTCYAHVGRFMIQTFGSSESEVRQRTSAQYALLMRHAGD
ncbi:MAG: Hsp70 family protein [Nocardiaceae bacterium]|nr:Hsp70 family protein [Nocardiaceae bacterium]